MNFSIDYDEAGFVLVVCEGDLTLSDINEVFQQGVALAVARSCFLVLSDFRKMHVTLSVSDVYKLPEYFASRMQELKTPVYKFKRALVLRADQLARYKFFETVSVNRSQKVRIFADMDEARAWLLSE